MTDGQRISMNPDLSNIEPIRIAPLQPAERVRWEELWTQYQVFYGVVLPAAVTESTWQRLHDGRVHGLGARDPAGHLVGIVHFLYHEDTWSTTPACYLQDLYVDAAVRGSGCGRKLIEAVAAGISESRCQQPLLVDSSKQCRGAAALRPSGSEPRLHSLCLFGSGRRWLNACRSIHGASLQG